MIIGSMGRSTAFETLKAFFGNDPRIAEYSYAKPARLISRLDAALPTTIVKKSFFTVVGDLYGNLTNPNMLGDFFFIGHDVRVLIYEATGVLGKELDVGNIAVNTILTFRVQGRPVVNKELTSLYLQGPAGRFGVTGTTAVVGSIEAGAHSGHHDLFGVSPNQPVDGWIEPLSSVAAITTATLASIVLYGWQFNRVAAA
jgi:hypothetical protein